MTDDQKKKIVEMLSTAYNMELETVCNYLANSIHLDGMLAQEVKEVLETEVDEELGHARLLANRIKVLGGRVPGSMDLKMEQKTAQPPEDTIDVVSVVRGVIDAESNAIEHYGEIIEFTDGIDYVTQDLCIELQGDEEEHRRMFEGFLREAETVIN
ncbi:MAG: ferritin-like domain-containing protein [Phycisphaeraceae bacterium]|nr:ferritin-like domain-containing protein [Phycisphaeraceae bacterium]